MLKLDRTDTPAGGEHATVYLVFELSKKTWQLGVLRPGSDKMSRYSIAGGDLTALASRLARCRAEAAQGGQPVRILSCYEAGLDGHWLHRWLTGQGVISHEIDPSSIEVNRRARRANTNRIDLEKLMRTFLAYLRGEPRVCSIVHVPTVEDEDRKRRTRERERLLNERTSAPTPRLHRKPRQDAHGRRSNADAMAQGGDRARARSAVTRRQAVERTRSGEQGRAARRHTRLGRGQDAATPGPQEHRSDRRARTGQRGVLPLIRQSPPGRQLFRAHRHTLRQRRQPPRARHQQGRQPAGPQARDRARLAVATTPARQRPQLLVPSPWRRHEGTAAPRCHRGAGPQADGGALALSRDRRGADRRRAASKPLNGRAQ